MERDLFRAQIENEPTNDRHTLRVSLELGLRELRQSRHLDDLLADGLRRMSTVLLAEAMVHLKKDFAQAMHDEIKRVLPGIVKRAVEEAVKDKTDEFIEEVLS